MGEALMLVQFLNAAITAGVNLVPLLEKVSTLIQQRHTEGRSFDAADLKTLFDEGDTLEQAARVQFDATLADPSTPPA